MQTRSKHSLFLAFASAAFAVAACGASNSSSSDESTSSNSTSRSGGAGGTGGSTSAGNTVNTTSAATSSVGGSGGTDTTTTGGAGGSATTSDGGTGGTSGAAGADGSSDSGGAGGSGGSGSSGAVGVLGEPCDSPGELACAGNNQKLTVVCGGDGEWEVNQTCAETEYCDSRDGANAGLCRVPVEECASSELDARFCYQGDVHTCAPDGLESALVEDCDVRCEAGACVDVEPCPVGDVLNCDPKCGDISDCFPEIGDVVIESLGDILIFRTAGYADAVDEDCPIAAYALIFGNGFRRVKATVAAPWRVTFDGDGALECALGGDEQCAISLNPNAVWIHTDDPSATPSNVTLEYVYPDAECP